MPHDVNVRAIVGAGIAIAITVSLVVLAVFLLLGYWGLPGRVDRVRLPYDLVIHGPALQSAPQVDLAQYRARKRRTDAAPSQARMPP